MIEQGLFQLIQADSNFQSLVNTASGNGVYWILAPKPKGSGGIDLPYIVMGRVHTNDTYTMAGSAGFREGIFQVDCYGSTYYSARAVANVVRELLESYSGNLPDSDSTAVDGVFTSNDWDMPYEEGSGPLGFIYRVVLEFRVWYYETAQPLVIDGGTF